MKLRYLTILGILLLAQSVVCEMFSTGIRSKAPEIEQRIDELFVEADQVASDWLNCGHDDPFIDNLWRNSLPENWKERGIALYLYDHDTLRYWNNHTFGYEIDSMVGATPNSIDQFDGNTLLSFRSAKGDRRAIVVIKLATRIDWFNDYIFSAESNYPQFYAKAPPTVAEDRQVEKIDVLGRKFYVDLSVNRQMPIAINLLGWAGVILLLWSFKQVMRRGVTSRNALQRLGITAVVFISLRLILNFIDIPNGGSFSWSSLGSLLITYSFVLILIAEAYSMRFRLRSQVRALTKFGQQMVLLGVSIIMCLVIVYFHYSMVHLIRVNTAYIEIYNIFSLNFDSLIFYVICALFVAMRMLYVRMSEAVLTQFSYPIRAALSIVLLAAIVFPLDGEILNTGLILMLFHTLFLSVYYVSKRQFVGRQFVYDLVIFTVYIVFFTVVETFSSRIATAEQYATQIAKRDHWEQISHDEPPKSLWFAVIRSDDMVISENNNYELKPLLDAAAVGTDTMITRGGMTHIVRHRTSDRATIVVSFERPTFVRIVSLWCYIFLWLLVVSGTVLQLCGLKIYRQYNTHSMIYRVRTMIFFVVIVSMGIVSVVVYQYSDEAYAEQQKNALKISVQELRSNFTAFADADSTDIRLMSRWIKVSNSSRTSMVSIFDTLGRRVGGIDDSFFLSRMSSEAFGALHYGGMPYYERLASSRSKEYAIAYTPLYWGERRIGYMGVMHLNPQNTYRKYALLSSIFNVFVIVFLLSIVLSLILYSAITKPLNLLYEGLSGIRNLRKIELVHRARFDDEVTTIITQYNAMIDYLEQSYLALARSEREGAWREMARQVAHEIKNPLTPMRLKIQMLQRSRALGAENCTEQLDSTLLVLLEQIDILNRIATEFSDLARLPEGAIVRIELSGLLANTVGLYSSSECIPVQFADRSRSKVYVNVDYASMSRVVVNLLQNAMQAIVGVGEVVVTLSVVDGRAVVEVRDTGRGIDDEVLARMFEPNFTTKSSGSGLGLAICRQIVENFGGTITAANAPGGGAILTVRLPLA